MKIYSIPLVPGPTSVSNRILEKYLVDYGSGDMEVEYSELYGETQERLRQVFRTGNQIAIMSGEGMVALWGALKSTILPGDRVLAVATGIFGYGIADMAKRLGAEVETVGSTYDAVADPATVKTAISEFGPKLVTAVHCETPSGTLNPLAEIGNIVRRANGPILYVDAVASAGGADLAVDDWGVDLCLGGSQKCLSAAPDMAIVSVSEKAWGIIDEVAYAGYDALGPWRTALSDRWYPYTPSWHGTTALNEACRILLEEGLDNVIRRHSQVAEYCRNRITEMGLKLYPASVSICSPTVTVVQVPEDCTWETLDKQFREQGLVVGGAFGQLAGKVFRIGHMGSQANMNLVKRGLDAIESVLSR